MGVSVGVVRHSVLVEPLFVSSVHRNDMSVLKQTSRLRQRTENSAIRHDISVAGPFGRQVIVGKLPERESRDHRVGSIDAYDQSVGVDDAESYRLTISSHEKLGIILPFSQRLVHVR